MTPRPAAATLAMLALASCTLFDPQTGPPQDVRCVNTDSNPAVAVSFAKDIRPMMNRPKDNPELPGCSSCHYASGGYASRPGIDEGGLELTTLTTLKRGGKTSRDKIVVAGQPCSSALVQKLMGTYPFGVRMPKEGVRSWSDAEIQLVIDWIAEGANGGPDE